MRTELLDTVSRIEPFDATEASHKAHVLRWIRSDAPLYRIAKPDVPSQHLVAYFVVFDPEERMVLLVDHLKAQAWLPTGGHVLVDEDPRDAVVREAEEELHIAARFLQTTGQDPLFATVTQTKGPGTHTDVSLWYIIEGSVAEQLYPDTSEFNYYRWLTFNQVLAMDASELDPHMHRFIYKLNALLG